MSRIYELNLEQQAIIDALFWLDGASEEDAAEIEALEAALSKIRTSAAGTVEFLAGIYLELKAIAEARKEAKQRAEKRQRTAENAEQRLKDKLLEIMIAFDLKKVSGELCDIRTQLSPGKLVYSPDFNPSALPDDCKKIIPEQIVPVAAEISKHIKAGEEIAGVELLKSMSIRIS